MSATLLKSTFETPVSKKTAPLTETQVEDDRFRRLLSPADWAALPVAVRRRFSIKVVGGASVIYRGRTVHLKMNAAGWLLAQAARMIGAPFPLDLNSNSRAAVVAVTDDPKSDGQVWTRLYARNAGFPQMVNSAKTFCGPTGLEEHVGGGVGMSLVLAVDRGALLFKSADYFLTVFGFRLWLPRWLAPGAMTIGHHDLGPNGFAFTLTLDHPIFGRLIEQATIFTDMEEVRL